MSFLTGGGGGETTPIYTGIQLQTSAQCVPFAIVWGTNRISCNILQYTDFKKHKAKNAGKGGPKNQQYDYTATILLGLCEGTIGGIGQVWKDGDTEDSLSDLGFTLFTGTKPQAPWGYMVAHHPDQAFSYASVAYLASPNYDLGSSAAVPNHSFEIFGLHKGTGYSYVNDADCAIIIDEYLTSPQFGIGFDRSVLDTDQLYSTANATTTGDNSYQTYCRAMSFGMSPALTEQEQVSSVIQRWTQITNTACVWTGYSLKFIPYCYNTITGNGVTFVPDLSIAFTLTDDDFISNGDDPVQVARTDPLTTKNAVRFTISDRTNQYNDLPVPWQDQSLIDDYGLQQDSDFDAHEITQASMATVCVALYGKRNAYIRNTYTFVLGPAHSMLEVMDKVTVVDAKLGTFNVEVTGIKEDDDGNFTITAQPYSVAVSSASEFDTQPVTGNQINTGVKAGPVNAPVIFEPPANLSAGTAQVWAAVSGGDGTTADPNWGGCYVFISTDGVSYAQVGNIQNPANQGKLSAALAAFSGANPDNTNTLAVDLTMSGGELNSVSSVEAENGSSSLCYVDGEFLSYETATLEASFQYDLTTLYRGLDGTTGDAHSSGTQFALIDGNVFKYNLPLAYVGVLLKFKFQSFNPYGLGVQDISDCVEYDYTPVGTGFSIAPPGSTTLSFTSVTQADGTSLITGTVAVTASPGPYLDHYGVQVTSDGGTTWTDIGTISAGSLSTNFGPALASTDYQARARAVASTTGGIPSAWVDSSVVNSGALVSAVPNPCTALAAASGGVLSNALTWTAPAAGPHYDGFKVYAIHGASGSFGSAVLVGQTTIPQFTHTGLAASDTWRYWVVAYNVAGNSTEDGPENATTGTGGGGSGSVEVDNPSGTSIVATATKLSFSDNFVVTAGGSGEALIDVKDAPIETSWVVTAAGTGSPQVISSANFTGLSVYDILVAVNGMVWPTSDYTLSGTSLSITTNNASGDVVEIRGPLTQGSGWAVPATGTAGGTPQVISSANFSGLSVNNMLVVMDGLVSPVAEYSLSGTNLTVTPNNTGSVIEIRGPIVGVVGGGGGAEWDFSPPKTTDFPTAFGAIALSSYTDDANVGLCLTIPNSHTGAVGQAKAVPSATSFTATMKMAAKFLSTNTANYYMCLGEATLNHFLVLGYDSRLSVHAMLYGISGFDGWEDLTSANPFEWYQIQYDHTTGIVSFFISSDGKLWVPYTTYNYSTHFGADPAWLGVGMSTENYPYLGAMSVSYWEDTL